MEPDVEPAGCRWESSPEARACGCASASGVWGSAQESAGADSSVILGSSPHTGQAGFFATGISRSRAPQASSIARRPSSGCPPPITSLSASAACIVPMIPGSTPSTPASAQEGTEPAGGGAGCRHR